MRRYYKYGTTPNITLTGSPTVSNGVISGFSTSKYGNCYISIEQPINSFEMYTKFTTGSSYNSYMNIIGPVEGTQCFTSFQCQVNSVDNNIGMTLYNEDTYTDCIAKSGVDYNTTYWAKWVYNGIDIKCYYSLDGQNYILNSTVSSTSLIQNALSKFISGSQFIGCAYSKYAGGVFVGSIDLTKTRIVVNGKTVWSGTYLEISDKTDYDYYVDFDDYKALKETVRHYYKYASPASGYREVTYLYAPAGSYIDTNFTPNSNSKIDCKMAWTTSATNNMAFGAGVGYQDRNIELYSSGSAFEVHYSAYTVIGSYTPNKYFRFVQDKGNIVIYNEDGSQNSTVNFGTKTFDCVYTMTIFALHRSTVNKSSYPQYLQYFKIYDNGVLVRDFIPVERTSDNVIGLYDKVNSVFYTNLGSSTFTKGEYIIEESTSSDYDFYKDIDEYKIIKETIRTYYKMATYTDDSTFTVPSGITNLKIDCMGAQGYSPHTSAPGGKGGRVECDLAVTPGQVLNLIIGKQPTTSAVSYNAADIRIGGTEYENRVIVAGGGGGGVYNTWPSTGNFHEGGKGGGLTGGDGNGPDGNHATGGTQSAGGLGSIGMSAYDPTRGPSGTLGLGGATSTGGNVAPGGDGGAGGAGYYGGGGSRHAAVYFGSSQYGSQGGSAGGGSSYTNSNCSNVIHTQGYKNGDGYISITYDGTATDYDYYIDDNTYKALKL